MKDNKLIIIIMVQFIVLLFMGGILVDQENNINEVIEALEKTGQFKLRGKIYHIKTRD